MGWLDRAMRLGRADTMMRSVEEAIAAADAGLPDFRAIDAAVGDDGRAAIALGDDARVAVVRARGSRLFARVVTWPAVRQTYEGLEVDSGDRRVGVVLVRGVTALDVRRLGMPAGENVVEDARELSVA